MRKKKETATKTKRLKKITDSDLHEMIQMMAYEIYEKNGCQPGNDESNWLEAKKIIEKKMK